MYGWTENNNKHANMFAGVLGMVIRDYWADFNQDRLRLQKIYFDTMYNWDVRANQWRDFLESMANKRP
jgi:hypothetical protein